MEVTDESFISNILELQFSITVSSILIDEPLSAFNFIFNSARFSSRVELLTLIVVVLLAPLYN